MPYAVKIGAPVDFIRGALRMAIFALGLAAGLIFRGDASVKTLGLFLVDALGDALGLGRRTR